MTISKPLREKYGVMEGSKVTYVNLKMGKRCFKQLEGLSMKVKVGVFYSNKV